MLPQDCRAVDAYWHMGSDISMLQVLIHGHISDQECGFYAHWKSMKNDMLVLTCVIDSDRISRNQFEEIMGKFIQLQCTPSEQKRKELRQPVKLA